MEEQRRHPRVPLRVPIFISVDGAVLKKMIRLDTTDVSGGGVAFETSREVPLDSESRVVVAQLGDVGEPDLIRGRVARIVKSEETGRFKVGVEFTGFEGLTREELVERIRQWEQGGTGGP